MDLIARSVILLLAIGSSFTTAKNDSLKKQFDDFYERSKKGEIKTKVGYPNRRRTQLYSRNTGKFTQVMAKGKVVARGTDGDKYADLEILTVSFGKVHIKGLETSLYICFDKRGRLIAKKRPTNRCVFRELHGEDAYTMYESEELNGKFLAFSRKGLHRFKAESKIGTKAVQFVERPRSKFIGKNLRYYTSRGRKEPIKPWMFGLHKMVAEKMNGRWRHLYNQNNPVSNPLHKNAKKHRQSKKKHSSKKSHRKSHNNDKQQEKTTDHPPKGRLDTGEKDLE